MKKYKHLSAEERAAIMIEHRKGSSTRSIARLVGRNASSVSRELSRNIDASTPCYDATRAATAYRVRRQGSVRRRKLVAGHALYQHVQTGLCTGAGRRSRLLPDFVGCTPTTSTNASATKRFTPRSMLIRVAGSSSQ